MLALGLVARAGAAVSWLVLGAAAYVMIGLILWGIFAILFVQIWRAAQSSRSPRRRAVATLLRTHLWPGALQFVPIWPYYVRQVFWITIFELSLWKIEDFARSGGRRDSVEGQRLTRLAQYAGARRYGPPS